MRFLSSIERGLKRLHPSIKATLTVGALAFAGLSCSGPPIISFPLITDVVLLDNALQACLQQVAIDNGWTTVNQVVNLSCVGEVPAITSLSGLGQLPALLTLDVSNNQIDDAGFNVISNPTLINLNVSGNLLTTVNNTNLIAPFLVVLNVSGNQINDAGFNVTSTPILMMLNISNNQITTINNANLTAPILQVLMASNELPSSLKLSSLDLSGLNNLQALYVPFNALTNLVVPASVKGFPGTVDLPKIPGVVANNNLLSSIDLSAATNLTALILNNNNLTAAGLTGLELLDKLEYLELSDNSGLGAVTAIDSVNHPNLKALGLANTGLSGIYTVPTIPSLSDYDLDLPGVIQTKIPGLNLYNNSLNGITFAPEHANLKSFVATSNYILLGGVTGLSNLTSIEFIELSDNIAMLGIGLTSANSTLKGLGLAATSILSVPYLADLPNLSSYNLLGEEFPGLNLAGNLFSILDLPFRSSVDAMLNLKTLDMRNNIFLNFLAIDWLDNHAACLDLPQPCTILH